MGPGAHQGAGEDQGPGEDQGAGEDQGQGEDQGPGEDQAFGSGTMRISKQLHGTMTDVGRCGRPIQELDAVRPNGSEMFGKYAHSKNNERHIV